MKISIGPGGRLNLELPQQKWHGEDPAVLQTSRFAGQEMMAIQKSDDEPDLVELHYLGFQSEWFAGMDAAQAAAPEFAREVLGRMSSMVSDCLENRRYLGVGLAVINTVAGQTLFKERTCTTEI